MPYLKDADIIDNVVGGTELLTPADADPVLALADRELEALAQTKGIYDVSVIGTDTGDTNGTTLVNGASQAGTTLIIDGFTASSGTVKTGTRISIGGLRQTYLVDADATIAGSAVTVTLTTTLESSPTNDATVRFKRLHQTVFNWLVMWVKLQLARNFMFTGDDPNQDREDDKYKAKYLIFKDEEKTLRGSITKEMIDNIVDEITDVVGDGGRLYRG